MPMSIVTGKVGSGKSLFLAHLLERELVKGHRPIVTSLAVRFDELNCYLREKYPGRRWECRERISRISTRDELMYFWRNRGKVVVKGEVVERKRGPFGDETWTEDDGGVFYLMDEIQVGFRAREFKQNGSEFTDYETQHRKLHDDIVCAGPHLKLIDVNFSRVASETVVVSNWYRMSIRGFRLPPRIRVVTYGSCPPTRGEMAISRTSIYIEPKKLGRCYNTAEGIGIVGGEADTKVKAPGVPWYIGALVLLGIWAVVSLGAVTFIQGTGGWAWGKWGVATKLEQNKTPQQPTTPAGDPPPGPTLAALPQAHPTPPVAATNRTDAPDNAPPTCTGWGQTAGHALVTLPGGAIIHGTQLVVRGKSITLDGETFQLGPTRTAFNATNRQPPF